MAVGIDQTAAAAIHVQLQHSRTQQVLSQHQGRAQARRIGQRPQVEDGCAQTRHCQRADRHVQRHPAPDLRLPPTP